MEHDSPYARHTDLVPPALTDVPCEYAPAEGLHLYHFPLSLCSQKVRLVLEEVGAGWESHVVLLPVYAQYDPAYVRINPRCVVPTLVEEGRVTTDSQNILMHVAATLGKESHLIPRDPEEAACAQHFVRAADEVFVEALSYGDVPGIKRPLWVRLLSRDGHAKKLELLDQLIEEHADDELLRRAYENKRAIVASVQNSVRSPEEMRAIYDATERSIEELDAQLEAGPAASGGWLCSKHYSSADVEWAVLLYRFRMLGLHKSLWGERPRVAEYARRLFARPSFVRAVVKWANPFTQILPLVLRYKIRRLFARLFGRQ